MKAPSEFKYTARHSATCPHCKHKLTVYVYTTKTQVCVQPGLKGGK